MKKIKKQQESVEEVVNTVINDEFNNEIHSDEETVEVVVEKTKTKVVRVTKDDLIKRFIEESEKAFGYSQLEVSIFLVKRLASKKSKTVLKTYLDELMLKLYRKELSINTQSDDDIDD